jgi:hypothetical protein
MTLEIQMLAWDRHNNMAGLNLLKGSQSPTLENVNTYINKRETKPAHICFHANRPHTITKLNDKKNIDRCMNY